MLQAPADICAFQRLVSLESASASFTGKSCVGMGRLVDVLFTDELDGDECF